MQVESERRSLTWVIGAQPDGNLADHKNRDMPDAPLIPHPSLPRDAL